MDRLDAMRQFVRIAELGSFAAVAQQSGRSFYLLGGTEEVNRDCARKLQDLYPALRIADHFWNPQSNTKPSRNLVLLW